jgi:hypothetical protein
MPLHRRRFALDYTVVPRTAVPSLRNEDGHLRPLSPTAALTHRRGLLRRRPRAHELRQRIDQLTAEAEAWIAELQELAERNGG